MLRESFELETLLFNDTCSAKEGEKVPTVSFLELMLGKSKENPKDKKPTHKGSKRTATQRNIILGQNSAAGEKVLQPSNFLKLSGHLGETEESPTTPQLKRA